MPLKIIVVARGGRVNKQFIAASANCATKIFNW